MLILTRAISESIIIDDEIIITVLNFIDRRHIKLGVEVPKNITIHRAELWQKLHGAEAINPWSYTQLTKPEGQYYDKKETDKK